MELMSEQEFRAYVVKRAKEYIFETTDNLKKPVLKESFEEVNKTLASVKDLVSDLKKINSTLSFQEPLMEGAERAKDEEAPIRTFHVGSYQNHGIELKATLAETMNHYNRQKSLSHGKEQSSTAWERMADYEKFKEQ